MKTKRLLAATLALFAALTTGCTTTESSLRARFARERGCPERDVKVVESKGVNYRATGCGESAEYVCGSVATLGSGPAQCEERNAQRKPGSEAPPFPGNYTQPVPPGPGQAPGQTR